MIEATLVFAFVTVVFETILIVAMPVRARLIFLGTPWMVGLMHAAFITVNLWISMGSITGTTSAKASGVVSFLLIPVLRRIFGCIRGRRWYHPGAVTYDPHSLV